MKGPKTRRRRIRAAPNARRRPSISKCRKYPARPRIPNGTRALRPGDHRHGFQRISAFHRGHCRGFRRRRCRAGDRRGLDRRLARRAGSAGARRSASQRRNRRWSRGADCQCGDPRPTRRQPWCPIRRRPHAPRRWRNRLSRLRAELAAARAQSEKLAASLNDVKSTPRESAAQPDLTAINERIAQIERATRAQGAEIAQESARPADDMPLRRIVAASLLDVLVRVGDPYPAALAAAKSLTDKADALKPLEGFAASGVPNANALSRELLTLVPKLSPPMAENSTQRRRPGRSPAGGCSQTGPHRAGRHIRHRSRRRGRAGHRGGAAQRFQ